ncbi:MAG: 3-deoxy-D-manno-octulosonic acid transferase [Candidatus Methylomirabilales bacterium]
MYLLYRIGLLTWVLFNLPSFVSRILGHKESLDSLRQRLGFLPRELQGDGRRTIWLHGCSVGEVLAAQPLAFHLRRRFPEARVVVSTTTLTGQALARERFAEYDGVFYFPFDWPSAVRRALDHVKPKLVVLLETEIGPNLLRECRSRRIPVIMVSGRISQRSFRRYRLVKGFLRRVLEGYSLLIMKADEDAERIRALGAPASKVVVGGSLKYDRDVVEKGRLDSIAKDLDRLLCLSQGPPLVVAGSTHDGEESIVLGALRQIRRHPDLRQVRLLLAPRHPERFDEVAGMVERSGFTVVRRSATLPLKADGADVILLDTIGELAAAYRFARVVFVGGTLVPKGGQSILEPALYAKPIVIGPHMENFAGIIEDFKRENAVVQLSAGLESELARALVDLLREEGKGREVGKRAQAILEKNRGAALRTVDYVAALFES